MPHLYWSRLSCQYNRVLTNFIFYTLLLYFLVSTSVAAADELEFDKIQNYNLSTDATILSPPKTRPPNDSVVEVTSAPNPTLIRSHRELEEENSEVEDGSGESPPSPTTTDPEDDQHMTLKLQFPKQVRNRSLGNLHQVKHPHKKSKIVFHYDNARPRVERRVAQSIADKGWELLGHLPCSPTEAPTDYHKNQQSGKIYDEFDKLVADVKAWIASKNAHFFARRIDRLPSKWEVVIEVDGDYAPE